MRKLTTEEKRAQETINLAISEYRTILEAITLSKDDCDPTLIEGETCAGYFCHLMVDPKEIAPILLKYDYPVFAILEEESPQAMWDELAEHFGLSRVNSFDL